MLENLQGNLLKPHGRKESDHLFLRFTGDRTAVRSWVRGFARDEVTSAREQLDAATAFRGRGAPGGMFANLYLSATGYTTLGLDTAAFGPAGASFRNGMKHREFSLLSRNRDPLPSDWEEPFRGRIDALVALADDAAAAVEAKPRQVTQSLQGIATVLTVARGTVLRNANGAPIEHS